MIDIDMNTGIYSLKQSTMAITSINKSNGETYSVISALVIDIHQPTQHAKTFSNNLFFS